MIKQEEYYPENFIPDKERKKKIWQRIEKQIAQRKRIGFLMFDRRSFIYGIAASIVLYLSVIGLMHLVNGYREGSQPTELKLDRAYETAIKEFERVVPAITTAASKNSQTLYEVNDRKEQLRQIDEAIYRLRTEIGTVDLSPLKRSKLRELYSMKLQILQKMIEEGDIQF
jgi:hypothetical protein